MGSTLTDPDAATATAEPSADTAAAAGEWNQELTERLYRLLYLVQDDGHALDASLEPLEQHYGGAVYTELIFLLSHLRFPPQEARGHWNAILEHREALSRTLRGDVDLRVAMLNYFIHINRKLESPKVIELRLFEQTQASAYRDQLTELFNHRAFREHLERELRRAQRTNRPLALLMLDVDDFKAYNDGNGHEAGNDVLAGIGRILQRSVRKVDLAARYGGEEFVVVLPDTMKTEATRVAELLRSRIESHRFAHAASQPSGRLTVSVGLAVYPADATHGPELVRCADRAMYQAKSRGKNQVALYAEDRRSYQRWEAELGGTFRALSDDLRPLRTINLSEGGLLFATDAPVTAGTLVEVRIALTPDRQVTANGRVASVAEAAGHYEIRVRFVDIPWEDRVLIAQHLRNAPPA